MDVEFFATASGRKPASQFIEDLAPKPQGKVLHAIALLQERGLSAGPPLVKRIVGKDGLWEHRIRFATESYRILFVVNDEGKAVFLHGFAKKSEKVLGRDIWVAVSRMREYRERPR